jgi:maleate cis-trans isomerase
MSLDLPLRVGLMVPANNTTMEGELLAWLPPGSTCQTLRIARGAAMLDATTLPAYRATALELARAFRPEALDLIVYGCTAAGFVAGPEADTELGAAIAAITGRPTFTSAQAMVHTLTRHGVRRVALVTPYLDAVNERLSAFLAAYGIVVSSLSSFQTRNVTELGAITAAQVTERTRAALQADSDAVFIACSQLPTLETLRTLSLEAAKPLFSSIQVCASFARELPLPYAHQARLAS